MYIGFIFYQNFITTIFIVIIIISMIDEKR